MPKAARTPNDKACVDCKAITHDSSICWNCKGNNLTKRFRNRVLVGNIEGSRIAKALKITKPGLYAVEVLS